MFKISSCDQELNAVAPRSTPDFAGLRGPASCSFFHLINARIAKLEKRARALGCPNAGDPATAALGLDLGSIAQAAKPQPSLSEMMESAEMLSPDYKRAADVAVKETWHVREVFLETLASYDSMWRMGKVSNFYENGYKSISEYLAENISRKDNSANKALNRFHDAIEAQPFSSLRGRMEEIEEETLKFYRPFQRAASLGFKTNAGYMPTLQGEIDDAENESRFSNMRRYLRRAIDELREKGRRSMDERERHDYCPALADQIKALSAALAKPSSELLRASAQLQEADTQVKQVTGPALLAAPIVRRYADAVLVRKSREADIGRVLDALPAK